MPETDGSQGESAAATIYVTGLWLMPAVEVAYEELRRNEPNLPSNSLIHWGRRG